MERSDCDSDASIQIEIRIATKIDKDRDQDRDEDLLPRLHRSMSFNEIGHPFRIRVGEMMAVGSGCSFLDFDDVDGSLEFPVAFSQDEGVLLRRYDPATDKSDRSSDGRRAKRLSRERDTHEYFVHRHAVR